MKKRGFTLIELIIVMGIIGIVLSSVYSVFSSGVKRNSSESNLLDSQEIGRNTIKYIGDAIINADYIGGIAFTNYQNGTPDTTGTGDLKAIFSPSLSQEDVIDVMHVRPYNNTLITNKYYIRKSTGDLVKYTNSGDYKVIAKNVNFITVNFENGVYKVNVKINIKGLSKTQGYTATFSITNRGGI